jgi:hypothetical protein
MGNMVGTARRYRPTLRHTINGLLLTWAENFNCGRGSQAEEFVSGLCPATGFAYIIGMERQLLNFSP